MTAQAATKPKKRKSPRGQNSASPNAPKTTKKKTSVPPGKKTYAKVSSSGYGVVSPRSHKPSGTSTPTPIGSPSHPVTKIKRPQSATAAKSHKKTVTSNKVESPYTETPLLQKPTKSKKKHQQVPSSANTPPSQSPVKQRSPQKQRDSPLPPTQQRPPSPPPMLPQIDTRTLLSWPLDTLQHEFISLKTKFETILTERNSYKQKYQSVQDDYLNLSNYCKLLKKELKELESKHNRLVQKYNERSHQKEKKVKTEGLKKKTSPELSERTMCTRKQTNILAELLSTEQDYVRTLRLIETHFYEPIRHEGLMGDVEQKQIFGNVEMVRQINEMFLKELEFILAEVTEEDGEGLYTWKQFEQVIELISRVFVSFKLYCGYIGAYQSSIMQLNAVLKRNGTLRDFLRRVENDLSNTKIRSAKLHSLLVSPIQRPPRYLLLIEQLLKASNPESSSHAELQNALTLIRDICNYLNKQNGVIENSLKMSELQEQLQINGLVLPSRKYIGECRQVEKIKKNGKSAKGSGALYIFNDLLLFNQKATLLGKKNLEIPLVPGNTRFEYDADAADTFSVVNATGTSFTFQTHDGGKTVALLRSHEGLAAYKQQ